MVRSFDRSGSLVAFKVDSSNQVVIYDLKKSLDQVKTVECESSILDLTIDSKNKFSLIVLDNHRLILYDVTLSREIEHRNQIKYFSYRILFLHLGAVWMGNYESGELFFHIQACNDYSHTTADVSSPGLESGSVTITSYRVNQDSLVCGYQINGETSSIVRYQLLDSRELKHQKIWQIQAGRIDFIELNAANSLILFVTDSGSIGIIDDEHIVMCEIFSGRSIRSVAFDVNETESFCVATVQNVSFFFYHKEKREIFRQDSISISNDDSLIAYQLPCVYLVKNGEMSSVKNKDLEYYHNNMKSIQEIIAVDPDEFKRLLHFKSEQDVSFWRIMAKRCVHDRDLDGALVCASKMREAALVRCLKQEMTASVPVAMFLMALHLNLTEESEAILEDVDPSLKSRLYRLQDKWPEAFRSADKIELKNLYYQYARQLESENKLNEAIEYYERSGNKSRILLMLFETENLAELRSYCLRKDKSGQINPKLVSWWGQYCESLGDNSTAVEMYKMANDYYNLVRILCHLNEMEQAMNVIDSFLDSGSSEKSPNSDITAAVLFLGKHLEGIDPIQSVKYYLECGAIRHAFRVCALHRHFDLMVKIAIQQASVKEARNILNTYFPKEDDFFEKDVSEEHAAMLYYKCDRLSSSINFAIKHRLWNFLRTILAEEMEKPNRRPIPVQEDQFELIMDYLKQDTSIVDIVIDLILMSEQENFEIITTIINQYGIEFNDSLMTKLETFVAKHHNQTLVNSIAELCLEKGNYSLAAKLFNKIGNRIEAIKALIRTGQEDKIIQFANVARDRTVYKLAANFLQTINHPDTDLVIRFYTKADAHEELERYKNSLDL